MSTMTIDTASSISQSRQTAGFLGLATAFFKRIGNAYERSEMQRKEVYLAGAVDLYDLECRIQRLDRGSVETTAWIKTF